MSHVWKCIIWASSWYYGTYRIGDQGRLRWACASAQSRQSLLCSHTCSMEVDEGSKNQTSSSTGWLRMRIWRMSLQRTKSAIISWAGSFQTPNWMCLNHSTFRQPGRWLGHDMSERGGVRRVLCLHRPRQSMPENMQEPCPGLPAQEPHPETFPVSARQCKLFQPSH